MTHDTVPGLAVPGPHGRIDIPMDGYQISLTVRRVVMRGDLPVPMEASYDIAVRPNVMAGSAGYMAILKGEKDAPWAPDHFFAPDALYAASLATQEAYRREDERQPS